MKYFFVIICISAVLTQNLSKLIVLIRFEMQKEFIAKNLCEKKEEKNNCCQGSCHLKKQLDEDEKKQPPIPQSLKDKYQVQLFCSKTSFALKNIAEHTEHNSKDQHLFPQPALCSIFHPPKV